MNGPIDENLISDDQNQYKFYRNFMNVEEAQAFGALLQQHDILYQLETSGTVIDSAIVGNGLVPKAVIKILARDFRTVNRIIAEQVRNADETVIQDHYLNQLNDTELLDIIKKQDEWSAEDISVAQVLLSDRGIPISPSEIERFRQERLTEIRSGKEASMTWVVLYSLGIVVGMFISLIFVGAGIGMGYYYAHGKATDIDGKKYFVFRPRTRLIGTFMFYGGLVFLVLQLIFVKGAFFGLSQDFYVW